MRNTVLIISLLILTSNLLLAQTGWEKISFRDGVNTTSFAVDSMGYFYAGVAGPVNGGLLRSTDKGITWSKLNLGTDYSGVTKVIVTAIGSVVVSTVKDYRPNSLLISPDHGENWIVISDTIPLMSGATDVTCTKSNILYVAPLGPGLYKSTDNGKTWISDSFFQKRSVGNLASINNIFFCYNIDAFSGSKSYLSVSPNLGDSWNETEVTNCATGNCKYSFTFNQSGNAFYVKEMYLGSEQSNSCPVGISADTGKSWVTMYVDSLQLNSIQIGNNGDLFTGSLGGGVMRSGDNGKTWISTGSLSNPFIKSMIIYKDIMLAGLINGIARSTDGGKTWDEPSGLNTDRIVNMVNDTAGNIFIQTYNGIYLYVDKENSWELLNNGLEYSSAHSISTAGNNVFALQIIGLPRLQTRIGYKLNKLKHKWEEINGEIQFVAEHPDGDLYAIYSNHILGEYILQHSTNGGSTWSILPVKGIGPGSIQIDSKGDIYLAGFGLWRSSDKARSFNQTNFTGFIQDFKIDTKDGFYLKKSYTQLFRSDDFGELWTPINNGLPEFNSIELFIDSFDRLYLIINAKEIFLSVDNGNSWIDITANLEVDDYINSLAFGKDSVLYVSTSSGHVFARSFKSIDLTNISDSREVSNFNYILSQNYPNPFNPVTTIKYSVAKPSNVEITLYDVLGNQAALLLNEYKNTGQYSLELNASHLPSGVYFYRMKSGAFSETKKLVLMK